MNDVDSNKYDRMRNVANDYTTTAMAGCSAEYLIHKVERWLYKMILGK